MLQPIRLFVNILDFITLLSARGGGGGVFLYKKDGGCSWEIWKRTPKKYQDIVL